MSKQERVVPVMAAVDKKTGEVRNINELDILEENDIAFNPGNQHLTLSKDQKMRTTALMLAINAYEHLIIKDAEYYRAVKDDERRNEGPKIKPATINAMVEAAIQFEWFISGGHHDKSIQPLATPEEIEAAKIPE